MINYDKLFKVLVERKINRKDLSEISGVSEATISRMWQGGNVGIDIMIKLAQALGVNIDDLIECKEEESNNVRKESTSDNKCFTERKG